MGTHFPKAAKSGRRHAESEHPNIPLKKGPDEVLPPFETDIKVFREIAPGKPTPKPEPHDIVLLRGLKL
jgi:hypothetical protein